MKERQTVPSRDTQHFSSETAAIVPISEPQHRTRVLESNDRPEEVAQRLKSLATPPEDPDSHPSTYREPHNHLQVQF